MSKSISGAHEEPRVSTLGQRAIVLGAGIAGTLAARALAEHFTQVLVLERDSGSDGDGFRKGVPQAKLVHALLRAGLDSINGLFPGFERELYEGGAVRCRPTRDLLFVDGLGTWSPFDVGLEVPLLSRRLIEQTLARRFSELPNVTLLSGAIAQGLTAEADRITGVVYRSGDGGVSHARADLIVDATGRADHSREWLGKLGFDTPEETRVEVDLSYAGCFISPRKKPDVLGMLVAEPPPNGRFGVLIHAQEGERMIAAVAPRGRDQPPPADYAGMLAIAERLQHPAPSALMREADPLTPVARFGFPASIQRHYERLERIPTSFLCIGDAICTFNPVWGQGMSVAALEVSALVRLLAKLGARAEAHSSDTNVLAGLSRDFYREAAQIIATPWQLSVAPDFAYETTRGQRPPELNAGRSFMRAFGRLAMHDAELRALVTDVYHLMKPREALFTPELVARVKPLIGQT
jgi:2-polyprenyl-6-methoxyphenol hydroxylase-like FAD-dependent oxidoreductase